MILYLLVILSWFVDPNVAADAMDGKTIEKHQVAVKPEKVSNFSTCR